MLTRSIQTNTTAARVSTRSPRVSCVSCESPWTFDYRSGEGEFSGTGSRIRRLARCDLVRKNCRMRIRVHVIALALVVLCSTLAAAARGPLRVLVTNDDGVKAPGIDALVRELAANPNLVLTVIAPAANQSGTGDQFTTTSITATPSSTAGAFPA